MRWLIGQSLVGWLRWCNGMRVCHCSLLLMPLLKAITYDAPEGTLFSPLPPLHGSSVLSLPPTAPSLHNAKIYNKSKKILLLINNLLPVSIPSLTYHMQKSPWFQGKNYRRCEKKNFVFFEKKYKIRLFKKVRIPILSSPWLANGAKNTLKMTADCWGTDLAIFAIFVLVTQRVSFSNVVGSFFRVCQEFQLISHFSYAKVSVSNA